MGGASLTAKEFVSILKFAMTFLSNQVAVRRQYRRLVGQSYLLSDWLGLRRAALLVTTHNSVSFSGREGGLQNRPSGFESWRNHLGSNALILGVRLERDLAAQRDDLFHFGTSDGERAGLAKGDGFQLRGHFQIAGSFDQDALMCGTR